MSDYENISLLISCLSTYFAVSLIGHMNILQLIIAKAIFLPYIFVRCGLREGVRIIGTTVPPNFARPESESKFNKYIVIIIINNVKILCLKRSKVAQFLTHSRSIVVAIAADIFIAIRIWMKYYFSKTTKFFAMIKLNVLPGNARRIKI